MENMEENSEMILENMEERQVEQCKYLENTEENCEKI